jgi:hypothetical protein
MTDKLGALRMLIVNFFGKLLGIDVDVVAT